MTRKGTFILADICGYTPFLTGVAIEHAKEIISHLFNALLEVNRGRWKVANIEGDCIFFYRQGREDPPELLRHARRLYETFCAEIIDISARAACPCGACSRVNQLGIKFIVHAGEFEVQRIGRRRELIGADVVVAHRLLKNTVPLPQYVLLTRAYAAEATAPELPAAAGRDEYEVIGPVEYTYLDLEPVRQAVEARNCFFLNPDQAPIALTIDIDAPPKLVWEAMVSRDKQLEWMGMSDIQEISSPHGQVGQIHRCTLPNGSVTVLVVTAVDEAARRMTVKWFLSGMKDSYLTQEVSERPGGGSRVGFYLTFQEAMPNAPQNIEWVLGEDLRHLKAYCEAEAASRPGPADVE